jgi:hypothetical protein
MELTAVLEALRAIPGPVDVFSDSKYVVDPFKERWYENWERRNWRTKNGPVANPDLWKQTLSLYRPRAREVTFTWVKGHSGDEWNDVVDRLANEAAETQTARSGDTRPENLAAPDKPARGDRSRPFAAIYAGTCAACARKFPVQTMISRNDDGKYVHAEGCPA